MNNLFPCAGWAEKLACKPADLTLEERAALQAHLATCPGCAATYADYQMLMARLRALPRPAVRALPPLASEIVTVPDGQEEADGRYDGTGGNVLTLPGNGGALPVPIPIPPARRRSWPQRVSAVAAALLLAALVGSLALLLTRHPQPPGTATFKLRPGWTVIAEYSGVGSKTITGQDIELPRLWGNASGCIGSGGLDIEITSEDRSYGISMTGNRCTDSSPIASPGTIEFDNTPHSKLDTIKVTADAKTRWFFQYTQAVKQPTLTLGPEWSNVAGFGGESSIHFEGLDTGMPTAYKTYGLVFTCFGTGSGYMQLTPNLGKITMPVCDGQPQLVKVHYPAATNLQAADVMVTGDIRWDIEIFGCANEQKCGGA